MAKSIQAPSDIRIASLEQKVAATRDLMAPGPGTPWEDRGSNNVFTAYFRTVKMALFSPVQLLYAIRRPETTSDATGFSIACGLAWGASWFIHSMILMPGLMKLEKGRLEDPKYYVIGSAMQLLIVTFGMIVILKFMTGIFNKIAATELQGKAPPVLTYNVMSYAMAPSALALIPFIGPPVALVWTFVLMCVAGSRRLHVSKAGTIIAVLMSWVATGAVATGIYFAGWFLWSRVAAGEYAEPIDPSVPVTY